MHSCIGQREWERQKRGVRGRDGEMENWVEERTESGIGIKRKYGVNGWETEGVKNKENSDGKLICVGPSLVCLARLCHICREKNQHILDNSTHHHHHPTSPTTHPHSIPLHSPVHKNNKTLIAYICTSVAPPPAAIRIMNTATKGDHQLSGSLILIGWGSLSLSNLMHNASKSESTFRNLGKPCLEIWWQSSLRCIHVWKASWGTFPPLHALTTGSCPVQSHYLLATEQLWAVGG